MQVFSKISDLKEKLRFHSSLHKTIGFVPTMGALHEGHISLLKQAKTQTDIAVVSIFVNPTQFNNKTDLEKYPRTVEEDLQKLESQNCDYVFLPEEKEMYPEEDKRIFDFGMLDKVMEGKHRKGHFNGVAQIVSKLFEIVEPDKAFFGEKDFQQLAIVKNMVSLLNLKTEIIGCPIVREPNGLAMSSRNMLLTETLRNEAAIIFKTLTKAVEMAKNHSPEQVTDWAIENINNTKILNVEYFEIVDSLTLQKIDNWNQCNKITGCIAVFADKVRLIDNISMK